MYTAAAGMAAQQDRIAALSNDLANASTTGYKPVRVAFRDLVYGQDTPGADASVQIGSGSAATTIGRSNVQGALIATGRQLDVALSGPGFIAVRGRDGRPALTRDGNLQIDSRNRLVTENGLLLDPPVTVPAGTTGNEVAIGTDGTVTAAGKKVGTIRLLDVPAPAQLTGGPDNTFIANAGSGAVRKAAPTTVLQQGVLEASAVDMASAMTDLIDAQRSFELASRAIQMQDQMLEVANGVKK